MTDDDAECKPNRWLAFTPAELDALQNLIGRVRDIGAHGIERARFLGEIARAWGSERMEP